MSKKIRNTYDNTFSEDVIYLHPIVPRIHELCQELSYVCKCVQIQIKENKEIKENKRIFHAPVSYLARKPYAGGLNSGEMLKANLFHDLGTKLIEMTRIDFSGVIDDQAISHLFLLHKQCDLLLKNKNSILLDFPTSIEIEGIFQAIKAKTSLLLFQSFYKPEITSELPKIDLEKSTPYERAKNFEILYEGEKYLLTGSAQESSGIKLLSKQINGFESLSRADPPSEDYSQGDDIRKYDEYINSGKKGKTDEKKTTLEKFLKNLLENPDKKSGDEIHHHRLDNLLLFMKELSIMKDSQQDQTDVVKYAKAMRFLLKCFYERLLIYKDFVAAEQKKETYANSFYKIDSTGPKIFISSFGCKLLHTQALQDEAYHKFNQIYREWLTEAQEEAMKKAIETKEAAQKAAQEAAQEAAQDTRKESISILSIFVALITFISVEISILKDTSSIADYLILTVTIYIFISSIIGVLYFKSIEGNQEKNPSDNGQEKKGKKLRDYSRITLSISIVVAVLIFVAGFVLKLAEKKTIEDGGSSEINIKNQINQMIAHPSPSDSVGFNASTNEKQGKTGSGTEKMQKVER